MSAIPRALSSPDGSSANAGASRSPPREHAGRDHPLDRTVGLQQLLGGHGVAAVAARCDERERDADRVDAGLLAGEEEQRATGDRGGRRRDPAERKPLALEVVRADAGRDRRRPERDERGQPGARPVDGGEEGGLEHGRRDGRDREPGPVAAAQPGAHGRARRQRDGGEGEPSDQQPRRPDGRRVRARVRQRLRRAARSPERRGAEHENDGRSGRARRHRPDILQIAVRTGRKTASNPNFVRKAARDDPAERT